MVSYEPSRVITFLPEILSALPLTLWVLVLTILFGSLLGLFVDLNTVKIVLPIVLVLIEFEHIYDFVMWLLRKIPFLGIK